jgi:hypothetical protein
VALGVARESDCAQLALARVKPQTTTAMLNCRIDFIAIDFICLRSVSPVRPVSADAVVLS